MPLAEVPGRYRIELDERSEVLSVLAGGNQQPIVIDLASGRILLQSAGDIDIQAGGKLRLRGDDGVEIDGGGDVRLVSSEETIIRGKMVRIN
ncbi:MAG: hypothetical protein IT203_11700 [Fimbriimonadaceae bacterium]|nr:hypothetical protein [Fimbriimonadaceae bacterium]